MAPPSASAGHNPHARLRVHDLHLLPRLGEPPRQQDDHRAARTEPMQTIRIDPQSSMGVSSRVIQQQILHQQVYKPVLGYNMMPEEWAEQEMAMTQQKEYAEILAKHEHSVEQNMTFGTRNGVTVNEDGRTMVYSEVRLSIFRDFFRT